MLEGFSKAAKPISDRAEAAAKKYVKEVKA